MDLDGLLLHYFETDDLDVIDQEQMARGREALLIDFGVERVGGRRFALWALLAALDIAPLPAEAFKDEPKLKAAADEYLRVAWRLEPD
jgi:hypothetical protein